jgi:hypothetical protein
MGVYVKDGTPLDGPALCDSCSYSHVRKGYRIGEELVVCRWTEPNTRVEFRVRECSGYADKTRMSMYDMERIAYPIKPQRSKEMTGFASVGTRDGDEMAVELVLDEES